MKHRLTCTIGLIAVFFLVTTGFAQNPTTAGKVAQKAGGGKTAPVKMSKPVTAAVIESDISEAVKVIEKNYGGTKKLDYNEIFKWSIQWMLHSLDPHSYYLDAKEYEEVRTKQQSIYYGIGATLGALSDENGNVIATYIKATFDGAPAHKAGIRYGDKIIDVNGTSMLGKPSDEVRTFLLGQKGTPVKITVERLATGKRETVEIIRDAVPQPSIGQVYMLRPGVGYMGMQGGFNETTSDEFLAGLSKLKEQGMTQLIIDLRGNGGGFVDAAALVANSLLNNGQRIVGEWGRSRDADEDYVVPDTEPPDRSPLVVLVDGETMSAAEILTGALQDHDRALIVGEKTFGKGLVQTDLPLPYGSRLKLTTARYYTPSGRSLQRDYSNGELYNYYNHGGTLRNDDDTTVKPHGPESKTDMLSLIHI